MALIWICRTIHFELGYCQPNGWLCSLQPISRPSSCNYRWQLRININSTCWTCMRMSLHTLQVAGKNKTNNTSFSGHHHKHIQLHADVFQWTTESFLPINRSGPTKLLQQSWDLLRSADLQCELMSLQRNISCREITCLIRRWSTSMEHTITVENKSIHCDVQQLKDQQKKTHSKKRLGSKQ